MIGEAAWELFKSELGVKSRNEVLAAIGLGHRNPALDARRLMVLGHFEPIESGESVALAVTGDESAALQFGPCCRPILGDAIVGVVNQGYGIVIHTQDCPLLKRQRPDAERLIDVEWDVSGERMFDVVITVEVRNARGVLASVAAAIANAGSNIHNVNMDEKRAEAVTTLKFSIEVMHRKHLAQVVRNVRKVPEVMRVNRERGVRR
jgi:(p)ppGpp synthase/HD superfamily hydrolase